MRTAEQEWMVMTMKDDKETTSGITFFGALTVLFIGLKLSGIIHWSWMWVLAPIWAPSAIILVVLVVTYVAMLKGGRKR